MENAFGRVKIYEIKSNILALKKGARREIRENLHFGDAPLNVQQHTTLTRGGGFHRCFYLHKMCHDDRPPTLQNISGGQEHCGMKMYQPGFVPGEIGRTNTPMNDSCGKHVGLPSLC